MEEDPVGSFECTICDLKFLRKYHLVRHTATKKHKDKENNTVTKTFKCSFCSKLFAHASSLSKHRTTCKMKIMVPIKEVEALRSRFEREKEVMQKQIEELLLSAQHNKITNNIETQNINININAFGNENTDYLDDKAILACIGRVYNSIPSLLEKIHFDPKHPENHNIKITNRKLPYASVMGNNQKWKTVDRKDAIDTMVNNSYNILDDKFKENKDKIPASTQQHFRGFQSKFDTEDKELMKEIKAEVDIMVLNGI
jgi:hypothetical protein